MPGNTFCKDKRHATPHGICLHAVKVPVSRDLLFLRRFAIDADRAVFHDQPDLRFAWQVLEVHDAVVLADLLDIPLDLILAGMVTAYPESGPHVIADKHRERLRCPSSASDRTSVVDFQVQAAIIVLAGSDFRNPFGRGRNHAFGQQCHRGPYGMVEDLIAVLLPEHLCDKIVADPECRLLTGHLRFEFPDPGRHPFDPDKHFDPVCKVACNRDLDIRSRVEAAGTRLLRTCNRTGKPVHQGVPVLFHLRREFEHSGMIRRLKIYTIVFGGSAVSKNVSAGRGSGLFLFPDLLDHGRQAGLAHLPQGERGAGAEDLIGIGKPQGERCHRGFPDPGRAPVTKTPAAPCPQSSSRQ